MKKLQPKRRKLTERVVLSSNFSRWNLINASLWDKSREKSCIGTAGLFYKSCSQLFGELKNYTPTRLLSGNTHEAQTFLDKLRKPKRRQRPLTQTKTQFNLKDISFSTKIRITIEKQTRTFWVLRRLRG